MKQWRVKFMEPFNTDDLKKLYQPSASSHKGQNGKLMVIGGSHLFHAASLWALEISSKIVDMVFYSSVPENNEIVQKAKEEFRNGIVVLRQDIENYIREADVVLIGPGMVRAEGEFQISNFKFQISNLEDIAKIEDEGLQTRALTEYLLKKYPHKKWVIDAGALQMMDPEWLKPLENVIITPHPKELERVFKFQISNFKLPISNELQDLAKEYGCTILLKGEEDVVCSPHRCVEISGGNAGMTKGGTGDVLAGLVAALACKNELFLAATAGSFINKKAGEALFEKVGYYFNASDLIEEIPSVMKKLLF